MNASRLFVFAAVLGFIPAGLFAADPALNAGSKIRGDYYHGIPNLGGTGSRGYSSARRTYSVAPQRTNQAAPQIARPATPAPNNSVAQADNAQNRSTRTFSAQPNNQVPTQTQGTMRYYAPRSQGHGWYNGANRKILGKYTY